MKIKTSSKAMMIASAATWGTIGVFVKSISVSSGEIALYRAILAAALIGVFLLITKQPIPLRKIRREIPLLVISGMAMGFNWILLFEAYKHTTVSVATLSYYFAPIIVTLACPLLFKEKMGAKQWICFAMSTLGIALITGVGDLSSGSKHLIGIALGLGAACLYATVILLNKRIDGVGGIHRTFLLFLVAIVVLLPYVALTSGFNLSSLDSAGWGALITLGLVHTGITYCMYFSSIKDLTGQQTAILSYTDPLVAVLASVLVLKESISIPQIIGGALILGFTLWNEIQPKNKVKENYENEI